MRGMGFNLGRLLFWKVRPTPDPPAQEREWHGPWWMRYRPLYRPESREPSEQDLPKLEIGAMVLLKGKPDRRRRVLAAEWHCFRYQYVYIVETNGQMKRPPFRPYWFLDQLRPVDTP
jgi:hypothetical protein